MHGEVAFDMAGFRGHCLEDCEAALHRVLLPHPRAAAETGQILRRNRHRVTARLQVNGHEPWLVKCHGNQVGWARLLARWRAGRARQEWGATRYLEAAGLPVPRALAYGRSRSAPSESAVGASFFVSRFLDGYADFAPAVAASPAPDAARLLARSGGLLRALHAAGFDHRDAHPGNLLVGPALVWVDLHRSRWGRPVGRSAARDALARFLHGLQGVGVGPAGRLRALAGYLGEPPAGASVRAWWPAVSRRVQRLERRRRRSRAKRCELESTQFTRLLPPRLEGVRRRSLDERRLVAALAAHDAALSASDARVAKRGRKNKTTCHGDVVVKEAIVARSAARLRVLAFPGLMRRGYRHAHALSCVGVDVALPLAAVEQAGRFFTVYEDLSRFPRLDLHARAVFANGSTAARRRLLVESARWLGTLHGRGVYHGDVKGINVRVEDGPQGLRFHLIDTDAVRLFDHPLDDRRRIKNLAQLAASIARVVTRADRLRWFRVYAASWRFSGTRRAFERRVATRTAAALARKIVVIDEPIE